MTDTEKKGPELTPRGSFLLHMVVGVVIGIGGVLPGVSGGVMAVSLGIYRPMIDAIAGFFKDPRKNLRFLLPIAVGAGLGFMLGAVVLSRIMRRWYTEVMWLFLGLVAGGVPSFIREANERGFKKRYLIATALGAATASMLLLLDRGVVESSVTLTPLTSVLCGAIVAVGTVFPGVSTAFVLMYLGWYRPMMDAFAHLELVTLLFLGAGGLGCALGTIKFARWLFDRFHGYAYYGVLGFLLVSAAMIFPGFQFSLGQLVSLALAAGGAAAAFILGKIDL